MKCCTLNATDQLAGCVEESVLMEALSLEAEELMQSRCEREHYLGRNLVLISEDAKHMLSAVLDSALVSATSLVCLFTCTLLQLFASFSHLSLFLSPSCRLLLSSTSLCTVFPRP